jgi:hypothetical protein
LVAFIIKSASISRALSTQAVSVVKYGFHVPHPKIITFPDLIFFTALSLLNLSTTPSIQNEFTSFVPIHFFANVSARAIELILIANIHILSALHLSIFFTSAHLIKFPAQTTIPSSIFLDFKSKIKLVTVSSISLSRPNHFPQPKASPDIFNSTLIKLFCYFFK